MREEFTRKLTESECRYNYIYIPKGIRGYLPDIFKIVVKDIVLRARVDSKSRIYLPVKKLAKPGDRITIGKSNSSELYILRVESG